MSEAREARAFTCISVGISYWVGYWIVGVRKGLVCGGVGGWRNRTKIIVQTLPVSGIPTVSIPRM